MMTAIPAIVVDEAAMPITVKPLSYALGAEIQSVDLAQTLSNSEFDQIHRTFLESGILLFRKQKITREQHIACAASPFRRSAATRCSPTCIAPTTPCRTA
jgi:alpha-ketoglutarate-dependent taurine dioxygenase